MKSKAFCLNLGLWLVTALLYSQQIDMDAVHAEENLRWGVYAFHRSYYNESIRSLETALSFKPQDRLIRTWLGRVLLQSGYEEAALSEWRSLLNEDSPDPLLQNKLQLLDLRRGIGPEIADEERMVVTRVHDAETRDYYAFRRPTSVKAAPDGSVYVVAYGSNEVFMINANGRVRNIMKGGLSLYDHPFDLVPLADGSFFLSEYEGHRIAKCRSNGDKELVFGKKGTGDGELLGPQFLCLDDEGYLYVTDWGNKRVCKFDQEGNFILSFGSRAVSGKAPAQLAGPTGIAAYGAQLLVADKRQQRIAVYDRHGNYLRSYAEGKLWGPEGISLTAENTLLVCDTSWEESKTRLLRLDLVSEELSPIPGVDGYSRRLLNCTTDRNGNLVTVDYDLNRVIVLSRMSDLYSGYAVDIQRIDATNFPEVMADIAVEDRYGRPVYGLEVQNFLFSEAEAAVSGMLMYKPVNLQPQSEVVLLVEKSPEQEKRKAALKKAASALLGQRPAEVDLQVISAAKTPALEIASEAGPTDILDKVTSGPFSALWDLGSALRLAGTRLLEARTRRAVVFFSSGKLGSQAFTQYSLLELVHFFQQNFISFHCIHFGPDEPAEELRFLCSATGGRVYDYYAPKGLLEVFSGIQETPDPRYILRYQSHTDPAFGKKYIELNAEVIMNKISGRDVLGYYAPLQ